MTWRETYEKWLNSPALSEEEWKELDAIRDDPKEIEDRFYAPLVFGTAGLRGIMGLGTNRMNIHVIRHATQAFAELIVAEGAEAMKRGVCVCHDCRNNGVAFAREAAAIMGLSPWATPATIWLDKTGRAAPKEETEAMMAEFEAISNVPQTFAFIKKYSKV